MPDARMRCTRPPHPRQPRLAARAHGTDPNLHATRCIAAPRVQDPEQVLRHYLLWHEAEGHSRKTEIVYAHTLRPFFHYLSGPEGPAL
jgi:hypothetical protein